jgi:hypothetical protein
MNLMIKGKTIAIFGTWIKSIEFVPATVLQCEKAERIFIFAF